MLVRTVSEISVEMPLTPWRLDAVFYFRGMKLEHDTPYVQFLLGDSTGAISCVAFHAAARGIATLLNLPLSGPQQLFNCSLRVLQPMQVIVKQRDPKYKIQVPALPSRLLSSVDLLITSNAMIGTDFVIKVQNAAPAPPAPPQSQPQPETSRPSFHLREEMERAISSIENQTTTMARHISAGKFLTHGGFKVVGELLQHILVKCQGHLEDLTHGDNDISWRNRCVVFFGIIGNDLFVAVADPHGVPETGVGVTKIQTLHFLPEEDSSPSTTEGVAATKPLHEAFGVYCVADGVDMLKEKNYKVIKAFVTSALIALQKHTTVLASPHDALKPEYRTRHFLVNKRFFSKKCPIFFFGHGPDTGLGECKNRGFRV